MIADDKSSHIEKEFSAEIAGLKPEAKVESRDRLSQQAFDKPAVTESADKDKKNRLLADYPVHVPQVDIVDESHGKAAETLGRTFNWGSKASIENLDRDTTKTDGPSISITDVIKQVNSRGIDGLRPESYISHVSTDITTTKSLSHDGGIFGPDAATKADISHFSTVSHVEPAVVPPLVPNGPDTVPNPAQTKNVSITDFNPTQIPGVILPNSNPHIEFPGLTINPPVVVTPPRPEAPPPMPHPELPGFTIPRTDFPVLTIQPGSVPSGSTGDVRRPEPSPATERAVPLSVVTDHTPVWVPPVTTKDFIDHPPAPSTWVQPDSHIHTPVVTPIAPINMTELPHPTPVQQGPARPPAIHEGPYQAPTTTAPDPTQISRGYRSVPYTDDGRQPSRPSEPVATRPQPQPEQRTEHKPTVTTFMGKIDSQTQTVKPVTESRQDAGAPRQRTADPTAVTSKEIATVANQIKPSEQAIASQNGLIPGAKPTAFTGALANMDRGSLIAINMPGQAIQTINPFAVNRDASNGRVVSDATVVPFSNISKIDASAISRNPMAISGSNDVRGAVQAVLTGSKNANVFDVNTTKMTAMIDVRVIPAQSSAIVDGNRIAGTRNANVESTRAIDPKAVVIDGTKAPSTNVKDAVSAEAGRNIGQSISADASRVVKSGSVTDVRVSSASAAVVLNTKDGAATAAVNAQKSEATVNGNRIVGSGQKDGSTFTGTQNAANPAQINDSIKRPVGSSTTNNLEDGQKSAAQKLAERDTKFGGKQAAEAPSGSRSHHSHGFKPQAKNSDTKNNSRNEVESSFQNVSNQEFDPNETSGNTSDSNSVNPAFAVALFMSISGLARGRSSQSEIPLEGDENEKPADTLMSNAVPMRRRTHMIEVNETLQSVAERYFSDARVAWLIADLNSLASAEHKVEERRVVELRSRQVIVLPEAAEINKFLAELPRDFDIDKQLVTIVADTMVNAEVLRLCLGLFSGSIAQPAQQTSGQVLPELTIV